MVFYDTLDNIDETRREWNFEDDLVWQIIEEYYNIEKMMENLTNYLDYEAFGRILFMNAYHMVASNKLFPGLSSKHSQSKDIMEGKALDCLNTIINSVVLL